MYSITRLWAHHHWFLPLNSLENSHIRMDKEHLTQAQMEQQHPQPLPSSQQLLSESLAAIVRGSTSALQANLTNLEAYGRSLQSLHQIALGVLPLLARPEPPPQMSETRPAPEPVIVPQPTTTAALHANAAARTALLMFRPIRGQLCSISEAHYSYLVHAYWGCYYVASGFGSVRFGIHTFQIHHFHYGSLCGLLATTGRTAVLRILLWSSSWLSVILLRNTGSQKRPVARGHGARLSFCLFVQKPLFWTWAGYLSADTTSYHIVIWFTQAVGIMPLTGESAYTDQSVEPSSKSHCFVVWATLATKLTLFL